MSDIRKNNDDEVIENIDSNEQIEEINNENTFNDVIDDNTECVDEESITEIASQNDDNFNEDEISDENSDDDISFDEDTSELEHSPGAEKNIVRQDDVQDKSVKLLYPFKKFKSLSAYFIIAIIALLVFTDIIPVLPNAYNRFYVGNKFQIGETQGGVFDKFGENVLYAGNGFVMSFGEDMDCDFRIESPLGTPKLETAGNNAVVYYANTSDAIIITDKKNADSIKTTYEIIASTINSKGYYAFATKEPGYKSYIEVFDKNRKSIYKFHTNNSIIDIAVSDNGKSMVASGYELKDNIISGKLIFIDLTSDKPGKEVVIKSNLISEVKYVNKDTAVAFGDMYTVGYTSGGIEKWRIKYGSRAVKSYDISPNGDIGFIFDRYSSELSESTVEIYNNSGKIKGVYNSKDNVKYISANNEYFLLSLDKQTVLIDDDADVVKKKNTHKEFRRAVLYSNYNFAFSVVDGVSEVMSVKH